MWISRSMMAMLAVGNEQLREQERRAAKAEGELNRALVENARLRADLDWFKLRLNQAERERGQLIQAAIGIKISVPEFVPSEPEIDKSLHEMPNFASVGGDAMPEGVVVNAGEDYSGMPGFKKDR